MTNKIQNLSTKFSKFLSCKNIFILSFILLNLIILSKTYIAKSNIENYFRIHVVANSNSISDQLVKYTVSDEVNNYITSLTQNLSSKKESKDVIEKNIQEILEIINNIIDEENVQYEAYAKIGNIYYDEKHSDNIDMAPGVYDSLQIVLGEGNGENWWSLIYPNAYDSYITIDEELDIYTETDDTNHITTHDLVSSENITYHFGLLELITNLFK